MKILVVLPVKEHHVKMFEEAASGHELVFCEAPYVSEELAQSADIIIGNVKPALIKDSPNLKWIQLNNAGTEDFCVPGALPEGTLLTNATGTYGMAISEHMIGALFMVHKHLHEYYMQQQECLWKPLGPMTVIEGSTTLVIGLGDIGTTFARKMNAMGSYIIGIRKSDAQKPDYVGEQYTMDALEEVIGRADVVAMALPGYDGTRHVINEKILKLMKKNAVIINVGRGLSIDSMALCDALNEERIAAACLDVTDPEPLPEDHPLWKAKNVFITPHVSGGFRLAETLEKILALSAKNLKDYLAGAPVENIIDLKTGYVKR